MSKVAKKEAASVIRVLLALQAGTVGTGINKDDLLVTCKRALVRLEKRTGVR